MNADEPERRTEFNREFGPEMDEIGMAICRALFPRIADALSKFQGVYVAVVEERSSMKLDSRYLGAWRGGGLERTAMNAAIDSLQTVQLILETNTIPMLGLYPLLRAAIESASLAVYMLAPTERDERLRRTYRVADDDARWQGRYGVEVGRPGAQAQRDKIRAEIRELVRERGTLGDADTFPFPSLSYSGVVTTASEVIAADPAVRRHSDTSLLSWWQLLSGLSHGKQWAAITALERSGAVVDEADASASVVLTTSPAAIAVILERAIATLEAALRLYGQRSKADWAQPEDASEPHAVPYVEQRRARRRRHAAASETAGESSA